MSPSSDFRRAQWRMLLAVMGCYLFFYTGRQNMGFALGGLAESFRLSKTDLGWITGALFACYGIGQVINGNLGDSWGARRLMTIGALGSCLFNWLVSFATSFWSLLILWAANGYFQSLGWAPGGRLVSNWWGRHERGKAFGFYVFSAGFSSILTYALCIGIVAHLDLPWPWLFRLPVLALLVAALVFHRVARDKPEDLGFQALRDGGAEESRAPEGETLRRRYAAVLSNGKFLLACAAIAFESWARYGLITWVPVHYLGQGWKQNPSSIFITLSLPVGMALGALVGGYLSDRLFKGNRSRPVALFLTLASLTTIATFLAPSSDPFAGLILLFLSGFFVYGPQSSLWALCPDLVGRHRAGTGVGVMDGFAYLGAAVGEVAIGWAMDQTQTTSVVFLLVSIVSLLGAACALTVRR